MRRSVVNAGFFSRCCKSNLHYLVYEAEFYRSELRDGWICGSVETLPTVRPVLDKQGYRLTAA
jgi:hypothetical protein